MLPIFLQASSSPPLPSGYGAALLQTLVSLVAVCLLAWLLLRWGARKGLGVGGRGGRIRVIERVALDARRSLYLVEVGGKVLLVGTGDAASPSLLTELDPEAIPSAPAERRSAFASVLQRARPRSTAEPAPAETTPPPSDG
ncbi:MAG: flagellar biosynthetic protein FliO [Myxococcales bacterium]|nr:flagellar biosynthetic protein FliO [Myxococcales bacterium]